MCSGACYVYSTIPSLILFANPLAITPVLRNNSVSLLAGDNLVLIFEYAGLSLPVGPNPILAQAPDAWALPHTDGQLSWNYQLGNDNCG